VPRTPTARVFGTAYRLLVADRTGALLAELEVDLQSVSWRLSDVGRATWVMAASDAKATETNLRYGNRVIIEFDNGLPNWVGMIDPPRDWREDGTIEINAYSGEYILATRTTDLGRYYSGATPGYIFETLLDEANAVDATGIQAGYIWPGGDNHSPEYHLERLLDIYQQSICKRLGSYDFGVTGALESGIVTMYANFYERRGRSRPEALLHQGDNVARARLLEQGEIINYWLLAGEGEVWGAGRIRSETSDLTSIRLYGRREGAAVQSGVTIQATLDNSAAATLAESQTPHIMFDLVVLNISPAGFAAYDLGDSVRLVLPDYGFGGTDTMVRILAREYRPADNACILVVRSE
jgi:hypothetical protein